MIPEKEIQREREKHYHEGHRFLNGLKVGIEFAERYYRDKQLIKAFTYATKSKNTNGEASQDN